MKILVSYQYIYIYNKIVLLLTKIALANNLIKIRGLGYVYVAVKTRICYTEQRGLVNFQIFFLFGH